ncbi:hypothetical protein SDC9_180513 [bioreactor metagenome]|uniref:Uncharacterized protein n=1 Tax=bioreactor metagenome TaxID=1076179 RepID=A0A645H2W9_9ZZZZ
MVQHAALEPRQLVLAQIFLRREIVKKRKARALVLVARFLARRVSSSETSVRVPVHRFKP